MSQACRALEAPSDMTGRVRDCARYTKNSRTPDGNKSAGISHRPGRGGDGGAPCVSAAVLTPDCSYCSPDMIVPLPRQSMTDSISSSHGRDDVMTEVISANFSARRPPAAPSASVREYPPCTRDDSDPH